MEGHSTVRGGRAACLALSAASGAHAQSAEDLKHMSIDDLAQIEVTSASKTAQAISDAPASIYVITHDDIVRSGALSVPEALRLAPNLYVARLGASSWVITARGFSGNQADQAFPDKLLVLIDGRSVYNPLFSGVYWDMQDVPLQNIERIEVISGPGATLWGANAVNGVINIITRSSAQTQGASLEVGAGDFAQSTTAQIGGKLGDNLTYRLYAKDTIDYDSVTPTGAREADRMSKPQEGFRFDWTPSTADSVTVQGDASRGLDTEAGGDETIGEDNLLARWSHTAPNGSNLQVQTYYDRVEREQAGGGSFVLNTYDLDLQDSFALNARNQMVVGGGMRTSRYDIYNGASLLFIPASRDYNLSNIFVQDSLSLTPATTLIMGLKLENDPYSGVAALPTIRLSWKASDTTLLWAAVSRAIRAPTSFDRDVEEKSGPAVFLTGNPNFAPETVTAYEAGARIQPVERLSFSASTYFNVYNDLRVVDFTPVTFAPLSWGNGMKGDTYGLEAWGDYQAAPWWRVSASVNWLHEDLRFRSPADALLGIAQAGDDPHLQAQLKSSMNLGSRFTLDGDLRYVGALPDPKLPAYTEMDARFGWALTDHLQLSVSGFNLLHKYHLEFPAGSPAEQEAIPRSMFVGLRAKF